MRCRAALERVGGFTVPAGTVRHLFSEAVVRVTAEVWHQPDHLWVFIEMALQQHDDLYAPIEAPTIAEDIDERVATSRPLTGKVRMPLNE